MKWNPFKGEGNELDELRRIRRALEVIALHFAALDNRMWGPDEQVSSEGDEEAELLHTDDAHILVDRLKREQEFMGTGYGEG